jgi:hypothetical protein
MRRKSDKSQDRPVVARKCPFPTFESLGQASGAIGAPQSLLKAAKRAGCKAFISGGRVEIAVLLPFLFARLVKKSHLPTGMASAAEWLTMERARREAIKREMDQGETMPTAEAERQAGEACGFFFAELERGERELPPALAGGSAVEIYERLHAFTENLRQAGKEKFEKVGK